MQATVMGRKIQMLKGEERDALLGRDRAASPTPAPTAAGGGGGGGNGDQDLMGEANSGQTITIKLFDKDAYQARLVAGGMDVM
jgi:hypothetical protein